IVSNPPDFVNGFFIDERKIFDDGGRLIASGVKKALSWPNTTTDPFTRLVYYEAPGEDDVTVENWYLDITSPVVSMAGSYACGTTTISATDSAGNQYLTTTGTRTVLEGVTTTDGYTGNSGNFGLLTTRSRPGTNFGSYAAASDRATASTTTFVLKSTEVFACSFYPPVAASTSDFTSNQFTGAGYLHMDVKVR
ncbi:MAG: hypothetical protein PHI63_04755, partial [Patescibacteria group bacterium]|nr:hypothetical protein [Patescibacteria group bacterium]